MIYAKYIRRKNKHLLSWKKSNLEFFGNNRCEVSMGPYPLQSLGNLRVVFIRTPKKNGQLNLWSGDYAEQAYDHYSIITNISSFEMDEEQIIEFYRQRANCENYIREQKYGFDFLNFPCQKLRANKVYGLIGTICHNLMRTLSFCLKQKTKKVRGRDKKIRNVVQQGYFSKKIRKQMINIPSMIVKHARKITVRLEHSTWEVFRKILWNIQNKVSSKYYFIQV